MFFYYPVSAVTDNNWLHESLESAIETIHQCLESGQALPEWPGVIPVDYQEKLMLKHGLRSSLNRYSSAVGKLSPRGQQKVLRCLREQNCIAGLLRGSSSCDRVEALPLAVRKPILDLFTFAFYLLTQVGVRDSHYSAIYHSLESSICPYCGCEYFDAPGAPREDLDHYLVRIRYPFSAANLYNLAPMGMKCNERYKKSQDMIETAEGDRRVAFYSYDDRGPATKISLDDSAPFGGEDEQTPAWSITFIPNSPESQTWDNVFRIRERFSRDVLNAKRYIQYVSAFADWFLKRNGVGDVRSEVITAAVLEYAEDLELTGFTAQEFLRPLVFRMLYRHCSEGDARLIEFLRDAITKAVPPPGI